jgi:hypothetical protein
MNNKMAAVLEIEIPNKRSDKRAKRRLGNTVPERQMVHCRDSRRNVGAECYNNNQTCGAT